MVRLKLCYVDETGTDGKSPLVVFVGVIADVARVHRTRNEFEQLFGDITGIPDRSVSEVKGSNLYYGNGPWRGVDGEVRHEVIHQLCQWLSERKHSLALAALDVDGFRGSDFDAITGLDIWMCGSFHIALQVQRAHQGMKRNKGSTFLVFDEHKLKGDSLADLLFDPPAWSDDYYDRSRKQSALDQITDTAFYARSHHVGLVQIADVFAFVCRRYSEILDYERDEVYEGEVNRLGQWISILDGRLLSVAHRWPKRTKSDLAKAYESLAPKSLRELG